MQGGESMQELTELFKRFPGIGQRQAERFARFIASERASYVQQLASSIIETNRVNKRCPDCFVSHESDSDTCTLCETRDANIVIVVEKDADIAALESSDSTNDAVYFVLGGLLPIVADQGNGIRIADLQRILQRKTPKEVLIALSAHPDADHTGRYIAERVKETDPNITVSMLGRGLSSGSELEYLDPNTLTEALKGRNSV